MPAVKGLDRISRKWARVVAVSEDEYRAGVENPRQDWATATAAAEANYSSATQKAISEKRFGKGVKKVGTAKWRKRALEVGPGRWRDGVAGSTANYEQGFDPYRKVIEALNLPPRGPKGDPNNIRRVSIIADALHQAKLKMAGG